MTGRIDGRAVVVFVVMVTATLVVCGSAVGQTTASATSAPATTTFAAAAPFKPEELEQLVAPIALYPDRLLAQVLMASTYPLEVVEADRWVKQHLAEKDQSAELNELPWDPSVKSLLDAPTVLTMMSQKLDWTVKLGDAFIADQQSLLHAVQRLRAKAYEKGNLKTTDEQKVEAEPAATPTEPQVIVVESALQRTLYVPSYDPAYIYGTWPYPDYPPYYLYPPEYVQHTALISFGLGLAIGAAWGHAWGECDWPHAELYVNVDQNLKLNSNIDRDRYRAEIDARDRNAVNGRGKFEHDASHRQGVAYRDARTTERFRGQMADPAIARTREAYRGRADAGRGGGVGPAGPRPSLPIIRPPARGFSGGRTSGFSGAGSNGMRARAASNRGQMSRASPVYRGGGGGGGARGGGGRR
jgi:hypothetical protein